MGALLMAAALTTIWTWWACGMALLLARVQPRLQHPLVLRVFHELRPFYLPAVAAFPVGELLAGGQVDGWSAFSAACQIYNWWVLKDVGGDDDRWKRRRRKTVESVRRAGGRLVVAPVPAGAS